MELVWSLAPSQMTTTTLLQRLSALMVIGSAAETITIDLQCRYIATVCLGRYIALTHAAFSVNPAQKAALL